MRSDKKFDIKKLTLSELIRYVNPSFFQNIVPGTPGTIFEHLLYVHVLHKSLVIKYDDYFFEEYPRMINRFTREFFDRFCYKGGKINWKKIEQFNKKSIK